MPLYPGRCPGLGDDYFEIIDTEEKAYWLGFLYADGCVARKGNYYTIKIDQALYDYEHVLKFKEAINSTYPVKIYNDTESGHARIIVGSKKMYDKSTIYLQRKFDIYDNHFYK